jgi:hypothetical protein
VRSVVVPLPSKSLSVAVPGPPVPPFSVMRSRPLGRKAIAVGWESPVTYGVSKKPGIGSPARAARGVTAASRRTRPIWCGRMVRS